MTKRSLDDAELVRYLYAHSSVTVPHIAKTFNVDVKTASYHLEKLVSLGLAVKNERSYGSKYALKPELTRVPIRFYLQTALTYSPLIFGVILFINAYYQAASLFLLISAILGVATTIQQLSHFKRGRLNEILSSLKKLNKNSTRKSF